MIAWSGDNKCFDMHLHSTASDGILSPCEVVRWAKAQGLTVVSLTDHDTVGGVSEAVEESKKQGVRVVPGIELSTFSTTEIHVLGYQIDYKNPVLLQELQDIRRYRLARNEALLSKLATLGVPLSGEYGGDKGRAHMAREMVEKGYASSVNDAFDRYLGKRGAAYTVSLRLTPRAAVELIARFGGLPVLAHPKAYLADGTLTALVDGLIPCGLRGLEVYYPSHTENDVRTLLSVASRRGLFVTSGSDMHSPDNFGDAHTRK